MATASGSRSKSSVERRSASCGEASHDADDAARRRSRGRPRASSASGDARGRVDDGVEVGVAAPAVDRRRARRAASVNWRAQLDQRLHLRRPRPDAVDRRGRRARSTRPRLIADAVPAERAREVDQLAGGEEVRRACASPRSSISSHAVVGDRRELAEQMVHRAAPCDGCESVPMPAGLPMPRLPSPIARRRRQRRRARPRARSRGSSPSVNRYVRRCWSSVGSWRRSHSSVIAACSFSSSRLCARTRGELGVVGGVDALVVPVDGLELLHDRHDAPRCRSSVVRTELVERLVGAFAGHPPSSVGIERTAR